MTRVLAELARIKVLFQLRAITAAMGLPRGPQPADQQHSDDGFERGGVIHSHGSSIK